MTDRGVSTALGYVLSLAIVTVLIAGIFTGGTGLVEDQREQVIRSELKVLGNRLAADVTTVDRLAIQHPNASVRLEEPLPTAVAGRSYRIRVDHLAGSDTVSITLSTQRPEVTVTVEVANGTAVAESVVAGGPLALTYDGTAVVIERG